MHERIPVDLRGRRQEDPGASALGEAEHVDGPMDSGFGGLDGVALVVHRACWAGQVEDLVDFHEEWERDIVANNLEARVVQ